jgi:hypothetical protein
MNRNPLAKSVPESLAPSPHFSQESSSSSDQPNKADQHYAFEEAELAFRAQQAEDNQGWADSSLLYDIHNLSKDNPDETNKFYEASKVAAELKEKSDRIYNELQVAKH